MAVPVSGDWKGTGSEWYPNEDRISWGLLKLSTLTGYVLSMEHATYRFSTEKAFAAIHWMVRQRTVDLHAALKACYFADKSHINEHFQPIFGATYRAMKYGPVPLEIYEIMKGEGLWLWEVGGRPVPWVLEGKSLRCIANDEPDMSLFAESEMAHLRAGFDCSIAMNFTSRTAATHGHDWQAANGGIMRYEDMIEESPKRDAIIRTIRETASHARL